MVASKKRTRRGVSCALALGWALSTSAGAQAGPGNIDSQLPKNLVATADHCDFLADRCMLPFPNDYFTAPDAATPTGKRIHFQRVAMPVGQLSAHPIDPTEWNRNDGFSPGAMILAHVPGIDLVRTGAAPESNPLAALAANAPIILIDADTLERKMIWAELDVTNVSGPDKQALIIRVAKNLDYGHRYIVVLRDLKDSAGHDIEAGAAFRIYRDNHPSDIKAINDRRDHMNGLLATLSKAGIDRSGLYLAWDFTVASEKNLTGRMLAIRDDAFAGLKGAAPSFKVTKVTDIPLARSKQIARQVEGEMSVPNYLTMGAVSPGQDQLSSALAPLLQRKKLNVAKVRAGFAAVGDTMIAEPHFAYAEANPGPEAVPIQASAKPMVVPFICNIPRAAVGATGKPAHASLYGHGLFGSRGELNADNVSDMANEHDFLFCAVNWYGFSETEVPAALFTFTDLSNAGGFFDATQQGILNQLMMGRLMIHPSGLASDPAFTIDGKSVIDTSALYYDGNSQGGIVGGALIAVSQDIRRGVLGVPGMNYSLLLERSADFDDFSPLVYSAYPDSLDEELVLSLWQMLWDRAEGDGYAAAMTNTPLPNTPTHQVLLDVAYGDHQVAMASAEVEARTVGAKLHCPALNPGRGLTAGSLDALTCLDSSAAGAESGIVIWDSGAKINNPPLGNQPPRTGHDPHEDPRATPAAREQKSIFLTTGKIIDVCGGKPCTSNVAPE